MNLIRTNHDVVWEVLLVTSDFPDVQWQCVLDLIKQPLKKGGRWGSWPPGPYLWICHRPWVVWRVLGWRAQRGAQNQEGPISLVHQLGRSWTTTLSLKVFLLLQFVFFLCSSTYDTLYIMLPTHTPHSFDRHLKLSSHSWFQISETSSQLPRG